MPLRDIEEIRAKLDAERAKLLASFEPIARAEMLRPAGQGGWSIKDILVHIAMAESVNMRFARLMLDKTEPDQLAELAREFPEWTGPFELDRFNAWMTERGRTQSLEEAITGVGSQRAQTVAWMETLTLEQLERKGRHALWGDVTVRSMLRMVGIHDRMHRGDIEKVKSALASGER